ncbi:VOC family protein [Massilia horti]|uniref:VOC family protein n=1 Tax=Massilia horti TaxID=2562153 RepID=A0A4Y9T481_9BURK|nr:VOC family protein [Massilia horti]TFW32564.1 VOC family protein [Massilia horti]
MQRIAKITPCLWFHRDAEEAAQFYVGVFPESRITAISRYGEAGREFHGKEPGEVLTVAFELCGQSFTILNGSQAFPFTAAISFQVSCETQDEIDYYWDRLGEGGDEAARQCGWLADKYGMSWQIVPSMIAELLDSSQPERVNRVMAALMPMKKLDIAALRQAWAG